MAGKYAVEELKQTFFQKITAILDYVCQHAIDAGTLATFQVLNAGR